MIEDSKTLPLTSKSWIWPIKSKIYTCRKTKTNLLIYLFSIASVLVFYGLVGVMVALFLTRLEEGDFSVPSNNLFL